MKPVIVGISGASGAAIGAQVVELLAGHGVPVDLVITAPGSRTLAHEVGQGAEARLRELATHVHDPDDIGATIASGSYPVAGMIVAPCSMRSLGALANSLNDNLLIRAADVQLKERRKLVLIPREAPLHLGHLRNMTAVTEMGAILLPPVPAFYLKPNSVEDITRQIAARAVDLVGVLPQQGGVWTGQDAGG